MIHFESDRYEAVYAGERIQLLPKEFALLRFLYEHAGRSFSRDALLDAVWPLEEPSDRTVDDHIYRVRKKVAKWSHLLQIVTIRGQGYRLVRHDTTEQHSPLLQDDQFAADVSRMFSKYHSLGMGAAMQLLAANREVLSLPGDPYYDVYIHFVRGDFKSLLEADSINSLQKAAYAIFIYSALQPEPAASIPFFEKLIAREHILSPAWRNDLRLNAVLMYLETGMLLRAREELDAIRDDIAELHSPSFSAIFLLKEMYLHVEEGQLQEAEAKLQACEELLALHPIQRERGACLVAKAMLLYRQGDIRSARQALDDGIDTTRRTQFIPHLLANLRLALSYLGRHPYDETYRQNYQRQWDQLDEQYRFDELRTKAERMLRKCL
ncbi:winged helix-turn-helix domain-containing protein [Paenibacillus sp. 1011MAR3C5]|uniref:winged helix-turn-helix domain-containing protein n=1 Tax=Paenibacillus sp. 1011MAR3C5 TaxID=1675787 RepID=UPI0016036EAD|nr:winged helix-turn-helix domain-containing protein [Paenibacillus sp. 1011MAR3C5]